MATVTGLTADRMLAIEAASVVDGDVVGDNLILTKHDGSQINAGNVRGPAGPAGPVGSFLSVLAQIGVLDIGIANQIRAGRQLGPADFANIGLSSPLGLWNLSDLTDVSGNGRNLLNKGGVTFAQGINGATASSALLIGATTQSLYIADTGAADPFRIRVGTLGCWFKTAKKGVSHTLMSKWSTSGSNLSYSLIIGSNNCISFYQSFTGSDSYNYNGGIDVSDDRWHFVVISNSGQQIRIYLDGLLDVSYMVGNIMQVGSSPFNIGSSSADAGTAAGAPFFGRIDEAFVTGDILSDDQIRNLYCAKVAHTLGAVPSRTSVNIRRRRRGAAFVPSDFPTPPLRLHNFSAGTLNDEGSLNVPVTLAGTPTIVPGADGSANNAYNFSGGAALQSTDAGMPSGVNPRSYGCWFKTYTTFAAGGMIIAWGSSGADVRSYVNSNGNLVAANAADIITGVGYVSDGAWHFMVVVEDNTEVLAVKRKLYIDGRLAGISASMGAVTLGGANRFRYAAYGDGSSPLSGQLDGGFVCGYALTAEQIAALYAKGSQALALSPKNPGDHIEAMSATDLLVTFDTLDSTSRVDLAVAA